MTASLNPRYTFDTFVVGGENRLAVSAARSVADNPGSAHNPLYIHGGTGLGKTHLLMAVGAALRDQSPGLRIAYFTLDDVVARWEEAASSGEGDAFRETFNVDVLLLDDVQFVGHRPPLQAELVRSMGQIQDRDGQIVLTSDRPPAEIADLDDGLLAKVGGGLVIDLEAPAMETRKAILQQRATERGVELSADVIDVVATGEFGNVRELLGVLNRLIAFQAISEHPVTAEAARALVTGDASSEPAAPAETPVPLIHPSSPPEDEFGFFMSGVTATVSEQVERLGGKIREAIERWGSKGYQTQMLESALTSKSSENVDEVLAHYEEAVAGLRALQHQMSECDPEQAGNPVFKDPARLSEATELVRRAQGEFEPPPGPSDAFDLDEFLESADSKMAVSAARSIVADPGTHYNPFVIVGGSGQGKTHLLHGIGRKLEASSDALVACVSAQAFVEQLGQAIEENRIPSWRARYRRARAFLLDNVDLIGDRERIHEELFFLFNVMEEAGHQLVFTSNVAPRQIDGLDDRLKSRLEGGLVVTLDPPDRALRRAVIVQQFSNRSGIPPDDLADYLADQPADSVRSVLGIGHRVLTTAEARGVEPTLALAREVFDAGAEGGAERSGGVVVLPSGGIESPEKVVHHWPDPVATIIEDYR